MTLTRRQLLTVGAALAALALTGCGAADSPSAQGISSSGATPPLRVVALGQGPDADTLIALGVVPVAMSMAYTGHPSPWALEALKDAKPEFFPHTSDLPYERIAALKPDLIVGTTQFGWAEVRPRLEAIAPVLGPLETGARDESWQEMTVRIGERVGRGEQARALVAQVETSVDGVRAEHPAWAGRTYSFGPLLPGSPLYTVSSTQDVSAAFLDRLGLKLPETITSLPGASVAGRAEVAPENLEKIDADVVMLAFYGGDTQRTEFERQPLFRSLPAVKRGSYVPVEPDVALGLAFPSALSIPHCLGHIAAQLDTALVSPSPVPAAN